MKAPPATSRIVCFLPCLSLTSGADVQLTCVLSAFSLVFFGSLVHTRGSLAGFSCGLVVLRSPRFKAHADAVEDRWAQWRTPAAGPRLSRDIRLGADLAEYIELADGVYGACAETAITANERERKNETKWEDFSTAVFGLDAGLAYSALLPPARWNAVAANSAFPYRPCSPRGPRGHSDGLPRRLCKASSHLVCPRALTHFRLLIAPRLPYRAPLPLPPPVSSPTFPPFRSPQPNRHCGTRPAGLRAAS